MNNTPFGFSSSSDPDEPEDSGSNSGRDDSGSQPDPGTDPMAAMFNALGGAGGSGTPDLGRMLQQIGQMLQWQGGPVNWDLATQQARQVVSAAGDRSVSGSERREVEEAFRLADTWLDDATMFPAGSASPSTWSRAEWVEGTISEWKALVEPVAERVSSTMGDALPAELGEMAGPLMGMMRQVGVSMWGAQVGQSIGTLAGEVFGATDIGIPLAGHRPAQLPANVSEFGKDLGVDERDIRLYLALRETAHLRLYSHATWLRAHVQSLIEEYAQHVTVDTERIESSLRDIDPSNPEAISEAMSGGLFDLPVTPAQQAALDRLELVLALVEGWVDDVVTEATSGRLPSANALRETIRRRRASGGPAEQTFASLVGLQLRPRRSREAASFWAAVREARGTEGREDVWASAESLPRADDLTDPTVFLATAAFDFSALAEELNTDVNDDDDGGGSNGDADPGGTPTG